MKGFNTGRKSKIVTVKLKAGLVLNMLLLIYLLVLTFINEALHLSSTGSPFVASTTSS